VLKTSLLPGFDLQTVQPVAVTIPTELPRLTVAVLFTVKHTNVVVIFFSTRYPIAVSKLRDHSS
jgi:hypothetical protein